MTQTPTQKPPERRSGQGTLHSPSAICGRPGCRESLAGRDARARFCSKDCSNKYWRTAQVRGGSVYELLVEWRRSRGVNGGLADIAHKVDQWLADDRDAGKP